MKRATANSVTSDLQQLWMDWLGTSERLLRALHDQTAALTLHDAVRVKRVQPEVDRLIAQMKQIDGTASAFARKLSEQMGAEPSLRGLVRALEKSEGQQLQALANRVMVAARNVQAVIEKNQSLMRAEIATVSGTLSLMARAAGENPNSYRKKKPGQAAVLLDPAA